MGELKKNGKPGDCLNPERFITHAGRITCTGMPIYSVLIDCIKKLRANQPPVYKITQPLELKIGCQLMCFM